VGLGEDWLFPLFLDAWAQQPVRIPGGRHGDASHRLPVLQARDLAAFLLALTSTPPRGKPVGGGLGGGPLSLDPLTPLLGVAASPFPKPYMLACNESHAASLATVAAAISAALGTGAVALVGDGAASAADQATFGVSGRCRGAAAPWATLLALDLTLAMQSSVFHQLVEKPRAKAEAAEAARAADAASELRAARDAAAKRASPAGNGTSRSRSSTARSPGGRQETGRSHLVSTARGAGHGKGLASHLAPPPPPAEGFAAACRQAALEFAACRGVAPLRVGVWAAPGAGSGCLARDLAQRFQLPPGAAAVSVGAAVAFVRAQGRALLVQTAAAKQRTDRAAKARLQRHAAHLAAVAAAAEAGEEAPPEPPELPDPFEVGVRGSRPLVVSSFCSGTLA